FHLYRIGGPARSGRAGRNVGAVALSVPPAAAGAAGGHHHHARPLQFAGRGGRKRALWRSLKKSFTLGFFARWFSNWWRIPLAARDCDGRNGNAPSAKAAGFFSHGYDP